MIIKEGRLSVKHTVNLGNYSSVSFEHSVLFDIEGNEGSVTDVFADARSHIDDASKADLERARLYTALGAEEVYVHEWIEEIY